jgi:hypothetical protein
VAKSFDRAGPVTEGSVSQTDEFTGVVSAARAEVAGTLRTTGVHPRWPAANSTGRLQGTWWPGSGDLVGDR